MKYNEKDIEAATSIAIANATFSLIYAATNDVTDYETRDATFDATREANSATGVTRSLIYTATCNATDNLVPR